MLSKIKCPIAKQAHKSPDKIALYTTKKSISYLELHQLIHFYQENLPKAETLFLHNTQDLETICLIFAALRAQKLIYILPPRCSSSEMKKLEISQFANLNALKQLKVKLNNTNLASKIPSWDLQKPATLIQSSGTTTSPKRVCHSLSNHYYSYLGLLESIPFTSKNCWALMLPLHHISGLSILFRMTYANASLYLIDDYKQNNWPSIHTISHASMVAAQVFELKDKKTNLKHLLLGGSTISNTCLKLALNLSKNVYTSYGSTETASQIYCHKINSDASKPLAGKTHPYCNLTLSKKNHLLIEGASLALGYFTLPNLLTALDKPFDSNDIAKLKDGALTILGRADNMFISGGENIYPETIERIFLTHPSILNCICLAKHDAKFGHVPTLIVKSNAPLSFTTLKAWAKKSLPAYLIPKAILNWPKTIPESKQARKHLHKHFKKLDE